MRYQVTLVESFSISQIFLKSACPQCAKRKGLRNKRLISFGFFEKVWPVHHGGHADSAV